MMRDVPLRVRGLIGILLVAAIAGLAAAPALAQDSSLRYFGYFASRITASGGDHLPEVAGRSNLNWVQISDPNRYAPEVLDHCKPRGCIISTGNEFFRGCESEHSPSCELYPNYAVRWKRLADAVRSRIGKVGAFYLMDEPQWRGATPAELHTAATTIRATYPKIPVMMVEAGPQVSSSLQIPTSVNWVGFDWYCQPFSTVQRTLATLTSRIHLGQSLFLLPEAAPLQACGGAAGHATDAQIAPLQYDYLRLAQSNPRVIGLLAFGFWTSGYGSAQLPRTVAAHEDIFRRIVGARVKIVQRRVRIGRHGVTRVRLRCPRQSARTCLGALSLLRRSGRGPALGSANFVLPPGATKAVRVRVHLRPRALAKRARSRRGARVSAHATTFAGETVRKLVLRVG
jgi:hypothetical protein